MTLAVVNYWLKWLKYVTVYYALTLDLLLSCYYSSFSPSTPEKTRDEKFAVTTGGVRFTIINDLWGQSLPIANVNCTKLTINVSNWSKGIILFIVADMHADYYNNRVEAWEPVIEDWSLELNWHKTKTSGTRASLLSTKLFKYLIVFIDNVNAC